MESCSTATDFREERRPASVGVVGPTMKYVPIALLALVACGDVLGADFDRPAGPPDRPTSKDGTLPVPASGECPPSFKRCGPQCARKDDPKFGCGADACTSC